MALRVNRWLVGCFGLLLAGVLLAQDPPLPVGLGSPPVSTEPTLPAGLEQSETSAEPQLPTGLTPEPPLPGGLTQVSGPITTTAEAAPAEGETDRSFLQSLPYQLSGFIESRLGMRLNDDPTQKDTSIGELRMQLQFEDDWDWARLGVTADIIYDPVLDRHKLRPDRGEGWIDLRRASLLLRPLDVADLELGRQILTWGTGDLVFINDLFPKDWNAFFIGRQDEYLKAPSDSVKLSLFNELANLDLVYTPRFNSDRYIDGRRLSFFSPPQDRIVGRDFPVEVDSNNRWFREDEVALRIYRNVGSWEGALYGYVGYWKSPAGQDPATGLATFPRLNTIGASLRGPAVSGIAALEVGYYDSRDDGDGDNAFVNNSEFRFLASYEQELLPQLTLGVQYYLEWLQDYDKYRNTLPAGFSAREEYRQVFTARLTRLAMNQNLTLSLFNYFSPSDEDGYLRGILNYKLTDQWQIEAGVNLFYGDQAHTFFNQFEENNNLYMGVRYGF